MTGHGSKFSRKMEEAVVALLTQRNLEEAARTAGIGSATLLRWQKVPEFQEKYRDARRAVHAQAIARLQQASGTAATVLLKVMVDADTPVASKVRAAELILTHATRSIEIEDIEVRLVALERLAAAAREQSGKR